MSALVLYTKNGEVTERSNVPPWKGGVGETLPGVRISPSPQIEHEGSALAAYHLVRIPVIELDHE